MEKITVKLKAQVHQVKSKSGTWDGKAYENWLATMVLTDLAGNFFGMAEGVRLPEKYHPGQKAEVKPGLYDAEISFEYKTDKRAFVPVIESLSAAKP